MRKAGEERRLAIERGDFCDEVPSITVICDGGWSKLTQKHSYNVLGGEGVIFGAETKNNIFTSASNINNLESAIYLLTATSQQKHTNALKTGRKHLNLWKQILF